ncbi:MAG: glycosyltransferase family 4 protein [Eubacteriales bacterium]
MKVLIATDLYKPLVNGVVTSVINLRQGLEKLGHEVRILALANSKTTIFEDGVYYIGSYDFSVFYPEVRITSGHMTKEIEDISIWKPDIIHTQIEFSTFSIAKRIAKKNNIPMVHTYHTLYEDYAHYMSLSKRVAKLAAIIGTNSVGRRVECIITPTTKIKKVIEGYGVDCDLAIIPSGISLERFSEPIGIETINNLKMRYGISLDDIVMVSVSRIGREKNIDELIQNVSELKEKPVTLLIVGDGPYKPHLEEMVQKLGVEEKVRFVGMIEPEEIAIYYKMADIFVSASTSETQGLTYIEALASGTPLLCKIDECLEGVLFEGVNGYGFENSEEFLTKLDCFMTVENKGVMSVNAKTGVEKYAIDQFAKSVESIYKKYIVIEDNGENQI